MKLKKNSIKKLRNVLKHPCYLKGEMLLLAESVQFWQLSFNERF